LGVAPPELLAAGWPLAGGLGLVVAWLGRREGRRRAALHRSLHELRRPLQILALGSTDRRRGCGDGEALAFPGGPPGAGIGAPAPARLPAGAEHALAQALAAIAELDGVVSGASAPVRAEPVLLRDLIARVASGWGAIAEPARIEVRWRAGEARVIADPRRLLRAFDNLIANALEHGTPPVTLSASIVPSGVRVAVADGGPLERLDTPAGSDSRRADPRRGHGLEIATSIAADHGGALRRWRTSRGGTIAAIDLPLAPPSFASSSPPLVAGTVPAGSPGAVPAGSVGPSVAAAGNRSATAPAAGTPSSATNAVVSSASPSSPAAPASP
jgi:hypothetical protein